VLSHQKNQLTYFKDLGLWFLSDRLANDTTVTFNGEVDICINPTALSQWIQSKVNGITGEGGGGGLKTIMAVDMLQQCCREGKYWTSLPSR